VLDGASPLSKVYDSQSFFTQILSEIEAGDVYQQFDNPAVGYNTTPANRTAAKNRVKTFLCPTNPIRPAGGQDVYGYGYTDYMPIAAVLMVDANIANRIPSPRPQDLGGLKYEPAANGPTGGSRARIQDGSSNTIIVTECVGRGEQLAPTQYNPTYTVPVLGGGPPDETTNLARQAWRWAEPASGGVVNGPGVAASFRNRLVNNNASPFGGGAGGCFWTVNDCGPNDEPFSFHGGGVNAMFADGHVNFIREDVDPVTFRRLLTANEGQPHQYVD
jgi:prepilin-type processing-associated H-X9-DG protein